MIYYSTFEVGACAVTACDCGRNPFWLPWKAFYHTNRWADY